VPPHIDCLPSAIVNHSLHLPVVCSFPHLLSQSPKTSTKRPPLGFLICVLFSETGLLASRPDQGTSFRLAPAFRWHYQERKHPPGDLARYGSTLGISLVSLASSGGVRLSPVGTSATNWPIVPAPDDRWWWVWSSRWNEYSEKTCPSTTLSTTNPT
jgi:hypothetical protein